MGKNKSLYKFDYLHRYHNANGIILTKWGLIKKFISFLRNPEALQMQITKINNVKISQNQTWEYDETKNDFVLETDLRGKENYDLWNQDKNIE